MKVSFALGLALVATVRRWPRLPGGGGRGEVCDPVGNLGFVCGPLNSEDLVQVPGTTWIVASGMDGGAAGMRGSLHLVDSVDKSWKVLFPDGNPQVRWDRETYSDCPGPPDLAKFSAHGLNLRPRTDGASTLYVVNHGGRESIEIFALDAKGSEPTVVWLGCAVMPAHTWPNSVAPLPDGGMVVTDMFDPGDPKISEKLAAGADTGAVYEWHPHKGFTLVPNSQMSGNNGIEVSRDGKWIYVAAWGNKAVVRLARSGGAAKRDVLPAGFLVDNLRWAPDGSLIVAGQNVPAGAVFACFQSKAARCIQPWRIDRWDTAAMTLAAGDSSKPGNPEFGDATVGLQIGVDMFVGTFPRRPHRLFLAQVAPAAAGATSLKIDQARALVPQPARHAVVERRRIRTRHRLGDDIIAVEPTGISHRRQEQRGLRALFGADHERLRQSPAEFGETAMLGQPGRNDARMQAHRDHSRPSSRRASSRVNRMLHSLERP